MACGGDPGARLACRLAMPISGAALLRILRRLTASECPAVRVLGVDDFAFRKGFTYGTILCDLERGRPIDLLPERSKESFQDWLAIRPGVEIVSRDRGEPFAQGAAAGAPRRLPCRRSLAFTRQPAGRCSQVVGADVRPVAPASLSRLQRNNLGKRLVNNVWNDMSRLGNCIAAAGTIGELGVVWEFTPIPSVSSWKPIRFPSESRRIASARRSRLRDISRNAGMPASVKREFFTKK